MTRLSSTIALLLALTITGVVHSQQAQTRPLRIIAITGWGQDADRQRSREAGVDVQPDARVVVGLDRLRIVSADVATGQKTSIAAGKYITRKLFVEVITDGQGYSATQLEYQLTRWISLLSTLSTVGRSSASVRISKDY